MVGRGVGERDNRGRDERREGREVWMMVGRNEVSDCMRVMI